MLKTTILISALALVCGALAIEDDKRVSRLEEKAKAVSEKITELAKAGKLPNTDEGVELLKRLVDELAEVRRELRETKTRLDAVEGKVKQPPMPPAQNLGRLTLTGYAQFQYRMSDESDEYMRGFAMRRAEVNLAGPLDDRTQMKVGFDIASGRNNNELRMKDAWVSYAFTPAVRGIAGQQNWPLGYDISRSSSILEFPERALYNRTLFPGERARGVQVVGNLNPQTRAYAGVFNSLAADDPEETAAGRGTQHIAGLVGIRTGGADWEAGAAGMFGRRPEIAPAIEDANRHFIYLDAAYRGLFDGRGYIRAEWMAGEDRLPNSTSGSGDMSGWQAQTGYSFDGRNSLHFRYEQFDPNGETVSGVGLSFLHQLTPSTRLMLANEWFSRTIAADRRHTITTLRVQFRF